MSLRFAWHKFWGEKLLRINAKFFFVSIVILNGFCSGSATAHQLSVFAKVQNDTVLITAHFADGSAVKSGVLRIFDAHDVWPIMLPAAPYQNGLRIIIDAGNGHDGYWILTPIDFSQDRKE